MTAESPTEMESVAQETPTPLPPDSTERLLSAVGYVGFLCLLPLLLRPHSSFCQHHGKQGLVLAVVGIVLEPVSWFFFPLYSFLRLVYYVVVIIAAVRAYGGSYFQIPGLYDLSKDLKF